MVRKLTGNRQNIPLSTLILLSVAGVRDVYVGATSWNQDRTFTWLGGTTLDTNELDVTHNMDINENRCLAIYYTSLDDIPCDYEIGYICEF